MSNETRSIKQRFYDELNQLPENEREAFLERLSNEWLYRLNNEWKYIARPSQLPPTGKWSVWLFLAGRGSGKTRSASEWLVEQALSVKGQYAIIGRSLTEVLETNVELESGIRPILKRRGVDFSKRDVRTGRFELPNGSKVYAFSGSNPDAIRGKNLTAGVLDEICYWDYPAECLEQYSFALRRGATKTVITTTPTVSSVKLLKDLMKRPTTKVTRGSSYDNLDNLSEDFRQTLLAKEGTLSGKLEIHAELIEDFGVLWKPSMFQYESCALSELDRIVVSIDPSISNTSQSNETGIVVAGKKIDRATGTESGYIIADCSLKGSIDQCCRKAVEAYHEFSADCIVVETNNGGDFIPFAIHSIDPNIRVKQVRATRGKAVRAEPIAGLYEQKRIYHFHKFTALEDQLVTFNPDVPRAKLDSPDRMDSLVWALTSLFEKNYVAPHMISCPLF